MKRAVCGPLTSWQGGGRLLRPETVRVFRTWVGDTAMLSILSRRQDVGNEYSRYSDSDSAGGAFRQRAAHGHGNIGSGVLFVASTLRQSCHIGLFLSGIKPVRRVYGVTSILLTAPSSDLWEASPPPSRHVKPQSGTREIKNPMTRIPCRSRRDLAIWARSRKLQHPVPGEGKR
ncbi:hypothetical protein LY76DRAFT_218443 [Colletotrichum caudatum]|nr:hypothetical protein LY76DRAFT_218443 [Colletotrichum caudatum]